MTSLAPRRAPPWLLAAAMLLALGPAPARAQSLAEVTLVAATAFATAGFFEAERSTRRVGAATHTRIEFEDAQGARTLLYLIDGADELLWLVAASR